MSTAKSTDADAKSSNREAICASGMISRGKYVLVTMLRYVIRLIVPAVTLFRKKNQGTRPAYAKIGYGTPPPEKFPSRANTSVNTAIVASGWAIAHAKPNTDWL